jgi:hypothetical protein
MEVTGPSSRGRACALAFACQPLLQAEVTFPPRSTTERPPAVDKVNIARTHVPRLLALRKDGNVEEGKACNGTVYLHCVW